LDSETIFHSIKMESIIQQCGDKMIQDFFETETDMTPEEWIEESILMCFLDVTVQWWEDLARNPTEDDIQEMMDYLNNKDFLLKMETLQSTDINDVLYAYGKYKAKEYRENWITQINNNA